MYVYVFGISLLVIFVCVTAYGIYKKKQDELREKQRHYVAGFSTRYSRLKLFVRHYEVHKCIYSSSTVVRSSLQQFRSFDYKGHMKSLIRNNLSYFDDMIQGYYANLSLRTAFAQALVSYDVDKRTRNWERMCEVCEISQYTFNMIEEELCHELIKDVPMTFGYELNWQYISPKGRNSYFDKHLFQVPEIEQLYTQCTEVDETEDFAKKQRRLLTPKLRYEILQRDGFKCVLCGRSSEQDGVKLEVDHIVPVSKGGLTECSNLRTLCWDCNRGKGSSYKVDMKN